LIGIIKAKILTVIIQRGLRQLPKGKGLGFDLCPFMKLKEKLSQMDEMMIWMCYIVI
jgi:hypothetical protein